MIRVERRQHPGSKPGAQELTWSGTGNIKDSHSFDGDELAKYDQSKRLNCLKAIPVSLDQIPCEGAIRVMISKGIMTMEGNLFTYTEMAERIAREAMDEFHRNARSITQDYPSLEYKLEYNRTIHCLESR